MSFWSCAALSIEEAGAIAVTHFTDVAGVNAIEGDALNINSYVTFPSDIPPESSATDIQDLLEIDPGKGNFSYTFETDYGNLRFPAEGPNTSSGASQFQLRSPEPVPPGSFTPTVPQ